VINSLIVVVIVMLLPFIGVVYGILPSECQQLFWVKAAAVAAASIATGITGYSTVNKHLNRITATITQAGEVIDSHNFPWQIKILDRKNGASFLIMDWYIDASLVKVFSKSGRPAPIARTSIDGLVIEFNAPANEVHNFVVFHGGWL